MSTVRATSHADAHRSNLAEACRLLGLPEVAGARQVDASFLHRRLKAGQRLTSQGEPFEALYIGVGEAAMPAVALPREDAGT